MSKYQKIKKELQNNTEIICCAKQFGVVGDETRLKICYLLCNYPELSVGDMAQILDASVSVVSHSVKKLLELDLVTRRKEAQTVYYSLTDTDFIKSIRGLLT